MLKKKKKEKNLLRRIEKPNRSTLACDSIMSTTSKIQNPNEMFNFHQWKR